MKGHLYCIISFWIPGHLPLPPSLETEHLDSWSKHDTCCLSKWRHSIVNKASAYILTKLETFVLQNQLKDLGTTRYSLVSTTLKRSSCYALDLQICRCHGATRPEPGQSYSLPPYHSEPRHIIDTVWKSCNANKHQCCLLLRVSDIGQGRG